MTTPDNIIPMPHTTPEFKALEEKLDNFSLLDEHRTEMPSREELIDEEKFSKSRERYLEAKANGKFAKFKLKSLETQ